jgi:hypothetical protein
MSFAETNRHAGHAAHRCDELIDELLSGNRADNTNVPDLDAAWWQTYPTTVSEAAARQASDA